MKKHIPCCLVISTWIFMSHSLFAQSCDPIGITTDPNNPVNTQLPALTNTFDWTQYIWPDERVLIGSTPVTFSPVYNPFDPYGLNAGSWQRNTMLNDFPLLTKEGWELIARGDGFVIEDLNNNGVYDDYEVNGNPKVHYPYIILYNKYSGILRVAGKVPDEELNYRSANIVLSFLNETNTDPASMYYRPVSDTYTNGLFNFHSNPAPPLDQHVKHLDVVMPTNIQADDAYFFSDLTIAYDPCVCIQSSGFNLYLQLIQTADIYLGGRILANDVDLSYIDGNGDLIINNDFLSSVYSTPADEYTAYDGQHTFKDMETMREYYQEILDEQNNPLAVFFEDILGFLFAFGGEALGDMIPEIIGNDMAGAGYSENEQAVGKGITKGVISGMFDFFSGTLDNKETVTPPRVITGEIALKGTLSFQVPFNDPTSSFAAPGSLNAETLDDYSPSSHSVKYPLYNEKLGVFNVMETPVVDYAYVCWDHVFGPDCYLSSSEVNYGLFDLYRLNPNLKYAFNDVLDIDYAHTKIMGALEFTIKDPWLKNEVITETNCGSLYAIDERLIQVMPPASDGIAVYSSPLMPIEALPSQVYRIFNDDALPYGTVGQGYNNVLEVDLQLVIDVAYNAYDRNGNQIKHLLMVKFPTTKNPDILPPTEFNLYVCGHKQPFAPLDEWLEVNIFGNPCDDLPTDLILDATTFTTDQTIEVTGSVEITGDLNTSTSGVDVVIRAGQFIGTGDPDIKIGPNIDLVVGLQPGCLSDIQPMDPGAVGDFCKSEKYGAGSYDAKSYHLRHPPTINATTEVNNVSLYPNPATTLVNISSPRSPIRYLRIIDIMGKDVSNLVDGFVYSGSVDVVNLNVSALPQGAYVVEVTTDTGVQTKKLIKY